MQIVTPTHRGKGDRENNQLTDSWVEPEEFGEYWLLQEVYPYYGPVTQPLVNDCTEICKQSLAKHLQAQVDASLERLCEPIIHVTLSTMLCSVIPGMQLQCFESQTVNSGRLQQFLSFYMDVQLTLRSISEELCEVGKCPGECWLSWNFDCVNVAL